MSQINITCPHCKFSKDVDQQRIPAGIKSIKCPKCQKPFALQPAEQSTSAPEEARPQQQVSEKPAPPAPVQPAQRPDNQGRQAPSSDFKFCSTCGQRIHKLAELCPKCGVRVATPANAVNKVALLLFTFFLGGMGGHKFYLKKYLAGSLYLLFFWTYIPTLVAFIEFILYACKSESELQQKYPKAGGSAVIFAIVIPIFCLAIIGILAAIAIPQFVAYREKAYNAAAASDLKTCKTQAEAYFADHGRYPAVADQLQCQTSKKVALYYLSPGSGRYQLISFHDRGKKAFLANNGNAEISEAAREATESQIEKDFGAPALERKFHFIVIATLPEGTLQEGSLGNQKLQNDAMMGVVSKVSSMGCQAIDSFSPYVVQMPEGAVGSRSWREKWIVSGCDNTYPIDITFTEDGVDAANWFIK